MSNESVMACYIVEFLISSHPGDQKLQIHSKIYIFSGIKCEKYQKQWGGG